jgi:hypothetical protein
MLAKSPNATLYIGGFSSFVASTTAPIATGWNEPAPGRELHPLLTSAFHGALRSFRAMGATGLMMPIHWGLFNLALHAWRQPIERVFAVNGLKLWSPEPGTPTEVVKGIELRSEWWRL